MNDDQTTAGGTVDETPTSVYETPLDTGATAADAAVPGVVPGAPLESQPLPGESAAWVAPAPGPSGRPARWRWWAALLVTVAVIGAAAGTALVMSRGTASPVLGYVPANAFVFAEARLDTPGSQGQALAAFLAHFPGFKDTSTLQVKLGDTWDRLVRGLSGNRYAYSTDVAPWAEGSVGIAVLTPKSGQTITDANAPVIVYVAVKDQAKAQAEVEKLTADAKTGGATVSSSTSNGATVWSVRSPSASGTTASVALLDGMLVMTSQPSLVQTVQDVKAGRAANLGSQQSYLDATSGAASDRLASLYVSFDALRAEVESSVAGLASPLPSAFARLTGGAFGTLRADSDRLTAELRAKLTGTASSSGSTPRASVLIDRVPATTLAYLEVHDLGKGLSAAIAGMQSAINAASPAPSLGVTGEQLGQVEQILSQVGPFASWIGDAAIAVGAPTNGSPIPQVAFVATAADASAAQARLGQLKSLISMGSALGIGEGLKVSDEQHGSTTITTVDVPLSLLEQATGSSPGTATPSGTVSFSWALAGDRFVLALTKDVVGQYLDVQPGQGLGSSASVQDAIRSAGGPAVNSFAYVDLKAVRAAVESGVPGLATGSYATDVQPYLVPFDRFVGVVTMDGSTVVERAVVTLSNP